MKPLQILACCIALLIPAAVHAAPPTPASAQGELQQHLTAGQTAYMKGDLATAKVELEWVLQLDPHNKTAIGFLRRINLQEGVKNKGAALEKQLDALMVPKLDFKEATLQSALDFMKKLADKLSNGKINVSFVVQAPPEQAQQVNALPITLSLSNIPFTEALRYIGNVGGLTFTYEKYAVVVRLAAPLAPPATPTGAAPVR